MTRLTNRAQSAGQGHGAYIFEAQGSGPVAFPCVELVDALKERGADGMTLVGVLNARQTIVDQPRGVFDEGLEDIAAACPDEDRLCQAVTLSPNRSRQGEAGGGLPPPAKIQA